jgi:tetratricopeptide (TPR) repeat protein
MNHHQRIFLLILFCAGLQSSLFAQADTTGIRGTKVENKGSIFSGTTYALVYGVSEYKNLDASSQLKYADNDAQDFYNLLLTTKLAPDSNNIYRKIDAEATASNFFGDFDKVLRRLKEGDRLIIYFAGHGDVEKNGVDAGYLLGATSNGVPYAANGTIDLDMLQRYVNAAVKAKSKVLLITDACRPGDLPGGNEGRFATRDFIESNFKGNSIIKLLSCGQGELSQEKIFPSAGGHGLFTYFLLEALEGMSVAPNKENITVFDIKKYLEDSVRAYSSNESQNPVIVGTSNEVLLKVDPTLRASIVAQRHRILPTNDVTMRSGEKKTYSLSPEDSILHLKFYTQLKNGQLNEPEGNNAYETYQVARKTMKEKNILYDMKADLAAKLEDNVQPLLSQFIRGQFQDYPDSLFDEANNKLRIVQDLIDTSDFRYNEIKAKRIFFIAAVHKTSRSLELLHVADSLMPNTAFINFEIGRYYSEVQQLPDSALKYLNKATMLSPKWSYPRFMMGNVYYRNKEYNRAQLFFAQAIELQPRFAYALFNQAMTFKQLKQKDSANYFYQQALALDKNFESSWTGERKTNDEIVSLGKTVRNTEINEEMMFAGLLPPGLTKPVASTSVEANDAYSFYSKAYYLNEDGNTDSARYWYIKAAAMFDKAYANKTMPLDYYYTWGYSYQAAGNYKKAKEVYKLALTKVTNDLDQNAFAIAWIEDKEENMKEAIYWYEKAISYKPGYYEAYNNLGWAFEKMKNNDSAIYYYRAALQINPDYSTTISNLANIFYETLKDDSAIYYYKKYNSLLPQPNAFASNRIGISYDYLGQYDSAIVYFKKAISVNSDEPVFYRNLGNTFYNSKEYSLAVENYEMANTMLPDSAKTYFNLALSYAYLAEYQKAERTFKEALRKEKGITNLYLYYYNLGWTVDKEKKLKEALHWYTKTVNVKPDYLNALNNIAYTHDRLGNADSAFYWYKRALKVDPAFTLSLYNLASLYNDKYKYDSSLRYYKILLPLVPTDATVPYEIAQLYFYDLNYDSAIVYYERATALNPTKADYWTKTGDAYFDATSTTKHLSSPAFYQKAIENYKEAIRLDSTQFLAMNRLGVSYIYLGNYKDGIAIFEMALQKDAVYKNTYEYNLACIYSLQKNIDKALSYFERSIKSGYRDLEHMSEDTDLDNIRSLAAFQAIIEKNFKPDEIKKVPDLYRKKN